MTKICYLDYDGTLHADQVYLSQDFGIHMKAEGRALFEWAPILDELLAPHPDVSIVLATTWVAQFGFEFCRDVLPMGLQRRVVGSTCTPENLRSFDSWSRGRQIIEDVRARKPERWFAIDNDSTGWTDLDRERLIQTIGSTGIGTSAVQQAIRGMLISF